MSAKFDGSEFRKIMEDPKLVRNMAVIAHVDHGKSTLVDSFLMKAGLLSPDKAGKACMMDILKMEQEKGITIDSTSVSFTYQPGTVQLDDGKESDPELKYLFNCIDTPGHVDFTAEVSCALRVSDGALVVVDCIEGAMTQTRTVLRQAIAERVRPVMFLNKLDRAFDELDLTAPEAYEKFRKCIEQVNHIIGACQREGDDLELTPQSGRVGFGSGYYGWAFTVLDFARMYCNKFGDKLKYNKKPEWLAKKLWGDNYWNAATGKWQKSNPDGTLKRGFEQFILEPLRVLHAVVMAGQADVYEPILDGLGIRLPAKERAKCERPKDVLKLVMRTWLPAADNVLDMMVKHLPSPLEAQALRASQLYPHAPESEEARAIARCDPNGPAVVYVSKMVFNPKTNGFIAFGRVFSGTIKSNQDVYVVSASSTGDGEGLTHARVRGVSLMMAGITPLGLGSCPAGSLCGLVGLDKCGIVKSGTVSSSRECLPMPAMKFSATPVVRVALKPASPGDLRKLIDGLKRLSQADQLAQTWSTEAGEHILATTGELHKEVCLEKLRNLAKDVKFVESRPIVPFRESILARTDCDGVKVAMAKSANKHNRVYCFAEPLGEDLVADLESGLFAAEGGDRKALAKLLVDQYGWAPEDARPERIWSFGLPGTDSVANVVVNKTTGAQYVKEVQAHIVSAFHELCHESVLCGEPLRGVRFNVVDLKIHPDPAQRGAGQMITAAKRAFSASVLGSRPALQEPMFEATVSCPVTRKGQVYQLLGAKRGSEFGDEVEVGGQQWEVTAFLPVLESFGLSEALRETTSGEASVALSFARWQSLESDPLQEGSRAHKLLLETRVRNRVKPVHAAPRMKDFHDKL